MDETTFLQKLGLLPKLDPIERTLSHIKSQRAYIAFYTSEGRAYMSSWRNDNIAENTDKDIRKETAMIDLGTPVLKPRVQRVSKSVISVCSTKSGEKKRVENATVHLATIKTTKKCNDEQGAEKGKKRELKTDKSKKTSRKKSQPKKKRNPSLSDSSTGAERLKERRERKRAKRAILSPPSSSDKENVEEKHPARKKMPVGFALMHGFTATNVGKNRLTVKPSMSIGVFNKGKASTKTKAKKIKASSKKRQATTAYFSESRFLNKTKALLEDDEMSCVSTATPSISAAIKKSKKNSQRKVDTDISSIASDNKTTPAPSSPQKKLSAASIVWDIELGKSLCSDDPPMPTIPAEKLGSVVLDVTRSNWAKVLEKCDSDQDKPPIVILSRPDTGSKGENEALPSIAPSQSASQIITKVTSAPKRGFQEAQRSKYFQDEQRKSGIRAESTSPPSVHQDDVDLLHAPEEYELLVEETNVAADLHVPTEIPEFVAGSQGEPRCEEQESSRIVISPFDTLDQGQDINVGVQDLDDQVWTGHEEIFNVGVQDPDDQVWTGHEEINCFDEPFGEYVYSEIPIPEEDYVMQEKDGIEWDHELDPGYNIFQSFEFGGDLTQYHDCLVGDGINDYMEIEERYDYASTQEQELPYCSEAKQATELDQNECESSSQHLSEISEKEGIQQVHRFSQGRALLSGCPVQEIRHSNQTPAHFPRLSLLEADVAKSLRDHWHPQRL